MVQLLRNAGSEITLVTPGPPTLLQKALVWSGNLFFRFRNALFPLLFISLALFTRPSFFLGRHDLDSIVVWVGVLTAVTGQCFRLFVIGFAYIKRGGKDGRVHADQLVTQGVYAHTRNPMYAGNVLIAVGLGLAYGSPWVYFFVIPFFAFVYLSIVVAEETYLCARFGKIYEDYAGRVNRFWPNFRGMEESLKKFKYDWKRAVRKEYGTFFGTLLGIVVIPLWKLYYLYGFSEKKNAILTLAALIPPGFCLYLLVRFLKLSGRLASPKPPLNIKEPSLPS